MDRDTFARQVVSSTDRMYRIARTLLNSDEDCRDAMQEAALKAWEKRHTLKNEAFFSTWLIRILINECRNIGRKKHPSVALEDVPEISVSAPDPALSIALQGLPEKLRLPFVMHAVEGMSYHNVAQALRLPVPTVTGRIHRAKEQLRKELAE